uniref:Uncharacterized protein n=1 Tax=Strongyloides venezuelensis TaxID=75913 RepID=A0A0K0ETV0_STRVS
MFAVLIKLVILQLTIFKKISLENSINDVTLRVLSSCHLMIMFDKDLADWNIVKNDLVSPIVNLKE